MIGRLEGVAVVTGGASGIGGACARVLAARGATVAILDRDDARAGAVAREVGGRVYPADVGAEDTVAAAADRIEREMGPVTILVNSAGIIQVPVRPRELSMAIYDDVVRVDQRGTWVASVAFARAMLQRRTGVIINIASIAGMRAMPLHAYAPAKAAVISMTECLAAEWGPSGVRVLAVSPGYTRTPALQAAIDRGERDVSRLAANAALQRLVEPEEIAKVVAFLASPEASAMTGVNVPVDCGWLAATPWNTYGGLRDQGN
jgi:NAD(P)-dependent dehydrogenase (short-subunit alcohol dehydrogenase family)